MGMKIDDCGRNMASDAASKLGVEELPQGYPQADSSDPQWISLSG